MVAAKKRQKASTRKKEKVKAKAPFPEELHYRLREGIFICTLAFALYVLLSLLTYHASDPSWFRSASMPEVANAGGRVGAYFSDSLFSFFGYWAYGLPVMAAYAAWFNIKGRKNADKEEANLHLSASKWIGFGLVIGAGSALFSLWNLQIGNSAIVPGGIVGDALSGLLSSNFKRFISKRHRCFFRSFYHRPF